MLPIITIQFLIVLLKAYKVSHFPFSPSKLPCRFNIPCSFILRFKPTYDAVIYPSQLYSIPSRQFLFVQSSHFLVKIYVIQKDIFYSILQVNILNSSTLRQLSILIIFHPFLLVIFHPQLPSITSTKVVTLISY